MEEHSTWRGRGGMSNLRFRSPSEFQPFLEELCATQQSKTVTCKMHNASILRC